MGEIDSKLSLVHFVLRNILRIWGIRHIGQYGRFLTVNRQLRTLRFSDVLDAGCGSGFYSEYICAKFPSVRVVAVDILEPNHEFSEKIVFLKEDLRKITFSERFNLIVNVNVLEYIEDYQIVLRNFYRALQHGGILVLHTPNKVQRRTLKHFENWPTDNPVRIGFAREQLIKKIEKIGFEIVLAKYTNGILGNLAWEMYRLTDNHKLIKLIILPLLKAMVYCDTKINHKIGNGLFIVLKKP